MIDQNITEENTPNDFPKDSTIFLGYNPGFGSGYDLLLNSWCVDLVNLISLDYIVAFTQANDYSVITIFINIF